MTEQKYIELINLEIDGLNSPKDSAKLKIYLENYPQAQNLYESLVELSQTLAQTEEIDPSPNLKKTILNSIDAEKYKKGEKKSRTQIILPLPKFNLKYVYVFAAGMILGIIGYTTFSETIPKIDKSNLIGSLVLDEKAENLKIVDHLEFDSRDISCKLNLKSAEGYLLTELDLKSDEVIRIRMEFDPRDINFQAIQNLDDNNVDMVVKNNFLELNHKGKCKYFILLKDRTKTTSPLEFKIFSEKTLLFAETLSAEHNGK